MRVLVAEDDAAIRHLIRRALDREGFSVVEAGTGGEALQAARHGDVQLAIVDLGLPDMSGLELIEGLRRLIVDLHVIIVSGAGSEVERVRGLVAGADDYMVKPVSLRELAARVVGVERRLGRTATNHGVSGIVTFGAVVVDVHARRATLGGSPIELTRREFDLLSYLALNPGVTLSRERLLAVVWSSSASWQSPSTVTEHIRRLRSKIEVDPAHPRWIVTVRGSGYRFDPDDGSADAVDPPSDRPVGDRGSAPDLPPAGGPLDELGPGLDADLRRALAADEFEVHYLPVVDLANREVLAVEALIRWRHPRRGLLAPSSFLEAAERSGIMIDLGIRVMDTACRQLREWRALGHALHVAVNLSARQLADPALPERIESLMVAHAVPVGSLWLEVSESTLNTDSDAAMAVLERTEMLGACMVIDDFGVGGASLAQVQRFPVHALKIDRVFVDGLGVNPSADAIARSILSLGSDLGLVVIAEGIETEAQLDRLIALGCRLGQGYLFGHPEPAERLALG